MAAIKPVPASRAPVLAKVDALLAARRPKIAVAAMVDVLKAAIARFVTMTDMAVPPGDIYEKTVSVLGRASKACGNPSLAARLDHCAHLVHVARTNVAAKLTMVGAELVYKAFVGTLPVLESPGLARLVQLNATMHIARTGESLFELPSTIQEQRAGTPGTSRVMDPLLAGAFFCGITGTWAIMGAVAALSIHVGIAGIAWLLVAAVLCKMRGLAKVKRAMEKWHKPAFITRETLAIAACSVLAVVLPIISSSWHSSSQDIPVELGMTASLVTLLVDPSQDSWLLVVKACTIGIAIMPAVLAVLAVRCKAECAAVSKKTRDFMAARAIFFCIVVIAWIAIIAWQHGQGTWYPSSIWNDGHVMITTSIGFAWYAIGLLGVLAA